MSDKIKELSDEIKELIKKRDIALKEKSDVFFAMRKLEEEYVQKTIIFNKIEDQLSQAVCGEE